MEQFILMVVSFGSFSFNGSMVFLVGGGGDEEEILWFVLLMFCVKEEEIEWKKMEVRERVQMWFGCVEEEIKCLVEICQVGEKI